MTQRPKLTSLILAGVTIATSLLSTATPAAFVDPLASPATASDRATTSMLTAVTRTPDGHWVAAGRRGHVILSADGVHWQQAVSVPVSTDLVSLFFVSAKQGWAVGHGGVILVTYDGGSHWTKQLDGHQAAQALVTFHEARAAMANDKETAFLLNDAKRFLDNGPGRPFLDIWFGDENRGYAIGAYNLLFVTTDGGTTWLPRPDLLSNEMGLHLSTIAAIGSNLYIAGEQGLLARLNTATGHFDRIKTPYAGSFFGLTGKDSLLVLFGLQGNAFCSRDQGVTWEKIDSGLTGTITAGTMMTDGRLVLASQAGNLAISADGGKTFSLVKPTVPTPISAIAPGNDDSLVVVGSRGVKTESLKQGLQHGVK